MQVIHSQSECYASDAALSASVLHSCIWTSGCLMTAICLLVILTWSLGHGLIHFLNCLSYHFLHHNPQASREDTLNPYNLFIIKPTHSRFNNHWWFLQKIFFQVHNFYKYQFPWHCNEEPSPSTIFKLFIYIIIHLSSYCQLIIYLS